MDKTVLIFTASSAASSGRLGVQNPHKGSALNKEAGLNPVVIRGPKAAKRALGEAESQHPRDRQTAEQDPVIPPTPPDARDGQFQKQCTKQTDSIGPTDPALR